MTAIRAVLADIMAGKADAEARKIMRSKLLVVGEGRVGKTSLVNALLGRPFSSTEGSTIGAATLDNIDAINWKPQAMHGLLGRNVAAQRQKAPKGDGSDVRLLDASAQHELLNLPLSDHRSGRRAGSSQPPPRPPKTADALSHSSKHIALAPVFPRSI